MESRNESLTLQRARPSGGRVYARRRKGKESGAACLTTESGREDPNIGLISLIHVTLTILPSPRLTALSTSRVLADHEIKSTANARQSELSMSVIALFLSER